MSDKKERVHVTSGSAMESIAPQVAWYERRNRGIPWMVELPRKDRAGMGCDRIQMPLDSVGTADLQEFWRWVVIEARAHDEQDDLLIFHFDKSKEPPIKEMLATSPLDDEKEDMAREIEELQAEVERLRAGAHGKEF